MIRTDQPDQLVSIQVRRNISHINKPMNMHFYPVKKQHRNSLLSGIFCSIMIFMLLLYSCGCFSVNVSDRQRNPYSECINEYQLLTAPISTTKPSVKASERIRKNLFSEKIIPCLSGECSTISNVIYFVRDYISVYIAGSGIKTSVLYYEAQDGKKDSIL